MDDRLSRLESEVERLASAVDRVEKRLSALESGRTPIAASRETRSVTEPASPVLLSDSEIARGITLVGRTLLILGGGYLLRALTETETVAPLSGAALGIGYALFWLVLADRAGAKANTVSAAFFGGAAVLVAFPLLWETTARFELLPPTVAATVLGLVSLVAIVVAWRHRLRTFAWVTVVGATITSVTLVFGTRQLVPFSLLLVVLAVATLWLAYHAEWRGVQWVVAGTVDLIVLALVAGVAIRGSDVEPVVAAAIAMSLFVAFVASFALRMIVYRAKPGLLEILQGGAATLVGYGGALFAAPDGAITLALGVLGVACGVGAYALAPRLPSLEATTYFEGLGWLLVVLGGLGLFDEPTVFFALTGLGLVWLGSKSGRSLLAVHGALLVFAGALSSRLVVQVVYAFAARAASGWPPVTIWMLVASLGAAVAYFSYRIADGERWFVRWRLGRLLLLVTLVLAAGGLALNFVAPHLDDDSASLAMARTAVLAVAALGLGWMARNPRFREAGWLVYPVLVLGGVKLVIEDFPHGRAVTLFVALALYGGALILAPRISRHTR